MGCLMSKRKALRDGYRAIVNGISDTRLANSNARAVAAKTAGSSIVFDDSNVDLSCFADPEPLHGVTGGWAMDFCELADRIYNEGENHVPNHDRDLLANGLPFGCATPRDGISIVPQMR